MGKNGLTHLDSNDRPQMVDVSKKEETLREAVAEGRVVLPQRILEVIREGKTKKGNVLLIAETAGIMACKKTPELIPLCHSIRLDSASVTCDLDESNSCVVVRCKVVAKEVTGVEMEALTGVSVAALTIYDMCKGIDKGMRIEGIRLLKKSGGKSGIYCVEGTE
ncbi:GTP cyclohydrolase subunit MoaC [Thermovirga lienii DSM 17291]|jgi:cyclic pyranopterin phosphate synthase|uniref:Cyclic pyranopterin monophosphate synthase n=1 Tax=Thermovirga lienii (strain ATCC BAA-1197 / DSM 17291 / Cas60314) TaxID=580340 RepID=G7VA22_THELD|nr:cyclic pyranopterin monophosphate synthase MoaC [Thermovirga lienii]AER66722.1 GTP cyclohydrolase subunit MoaC [Thermovirga lienii DSM 17291]MDN5319009.1 cyclic pyranopterin monophosphate synthase [Thermovirga sp.]MDN5368220.1 cyclic pyranopterin monophosphate synthase [Thermovirga sp.]HCD70970.1 cyclic pyranopterin monophosphate synthase MoaC [Thermovirga lienii]